MSTPAKERPFRCKFCDKSFPVVFSLKRHMTIHGPPTFFCDQCDKAYKTKELLKSHLVVHSGERPYKCNLCNKFFKRKYDVTRHSNNVHKHKAAPKETSQTPDSVPVNVNAREFGGENPEVKADLDAIKTNLPPITDNQRQKADSVPEFGELPKNSSGIACKTPSRIVMVGSSLTGDRKEQPQPLFIINDSDKAAENMIITVSIGTGESIFIVEQGSSVDADAKLPNPFQISFEEIIDELTKAGSKTVSDDGLM